MNREVDKYVQGILKKYGVREDDTPYFISYSLGYFRSRHSESMTDEEYDALILESSEAAQKYVKMLEKGEK